MAQVMQCVREARRNSVPEGKVDNDEATAHPLDDDALGVKNWLTGSYSRLKRSMESAVTHPTGRKIPILWRMYMSLEVGAIMKTTGFAREGSEMGVKNSFLQAEETEIGKSMWCWSR